jgi:FixJ family two-component response regulator
MKKDDLIFIVEDDDFYASSLKVFLNSLGFTNIEHYDNGVDSLKNSFKMPILVLLDYNLSDINGEGIMMEFLSFNSNIPIIFISAQESVQKAIDTFKYGSYDYIQKDKNTLHNLRSAIERISKVHHEFEREKRKKFLRKVGYTVLAFSLISVTFLSAYYLKI